MSMNGIENGPDWRPVNNRRGAHVMTQERHRARHVELHASFDELIADYLLHHRGSLPSKITITQLMEWSHQQTIAPAPLEER